MSEIASYKNLKRELDLLTSLYSATIYSYQQARKSIYLHEENRDYAKASQPIYLDEENSKIKIAGNYYEFSNKLRNGYSKQLRKILFIRLISILEVYLIDVVRHIFINRKDLFQEQGTIEFTYNEVLASESITSIWNKIISKKCRQLQNQGFKEVSKFYQKNFFIDFSSSPIPLKKIEFYHDCRHVIVHRLGKIDKQFEHTYNYPKQQIEIDELDFYQAISDVDDFSLFIHTRASQIINFTSKQSTSFKITPFLTLQIHWLSDQNPVFFNNEFTFIADETIYRTSDLLVNLKNHENIIDAKLEGNLLALKAFIKLVKNYEKTGILKILAHGLSDGPLSKLSTEIVKKVIDQIPKGVPIGDDFFEELATSLGIKKRTVKRIIIRHFQLLKESKISKNRSGNAAHKETY